MSNFFASFMVATLSVSLIGCASQRISPDEPVNRALKICGLGINAKSADAFKAAIDTADKKGISFETEASQAIDTQIGILLKQADMKSDANIRAVAEEMKATRECVVKQVEAARPPARFELLEQCRLDVQRRLSPPGTLSYGVVRYWNYANPNQTSSDIVEMRGLFDTGGISSRQLWARCDLSGSRFNEAIIQRVE
jgi:hypothetical protein